MMYKSYIEWHFMKNEQLPQREGLYLVSLKLKKYDKTEGSNISCSYYERTEGKNNTIKALYYYMNKGIFCWTDDHTSEWFTDNDIEAWAELPETPYISESSNEILNDINVPEDAKKDLLVLADRIYRLGKTKGILQKNDAHYERGLNDAWNCAKTIMCEMNGFELIKVFKGRPFMYNAKEAMDLIKDFKERKNIS